MYAFFLTVLCALAIQGSAWDSFVQGECCNNIRGFKECKRECEKVWVESKSGLKLKLALSLPKVCPSHLNSLWKCFNSSIKGFHLYTKWNLLNGKSCCLLAISESCREACFFNTNVKYLQQSRCPKSKEKSLLSCIDRNAASGKCCKNIRYRKCERACENVFSSDKEPNRKKIRGVKRNCRKRSRVFKCVDNFIGSANKSSVPDHKCCKLTTTTKCHDVCREVMSSKKPGEEKINLLKNSCRADHPFHHKVWPCFLRYSVPVEPVVNRKPKKDYKVDVTLHCCLRAKTEQCLKLCFKTYSKGGEVARDFQRRCEFKPDETTMLTCIADVSMPCHIGCSGLGFCTNFNHRHTELFRSCNRAADSAAKRDFENWWEKGRVEIPTMDFIPVKDIKKCLPDMWKAVACVLQIKPCHVKSHGSAICREDCLKVLGECAKKQQLGVRNVEMICKGLSPDEQTSCISLASYIKPSLYKNETNEVTHPCYPNPCKNNDVCEINREFTGRNNKKFVSYRCTPGCPIDHQSKLLVKNGDFARLPIVDNYKSEGCFKICRCDQERLSDCPPSPSCVKRKPCSVQGSKESYKHHDNFYKDCNLCVCFDGEVTCSKKQCLSGAAFNATGRPRRNHLPKDDNDEHANTGLPCSCKANYSASCGTNGKTYRSLCLALCARLQEHQISEGACSSKDPCDSVSCGADKFCVIDRKICIGTDSLCQQYMCVPKSQDCRNVTTELICDTENNQHFNRCSLHKSGKEIAYSGACKASCAPGRQEVCGVDGQTYSSECALNHARMLMDYKGPCTTIGKYTNEDPTARCAYIQCPVLKPSRCIGITPPGACCKVCATQLVVLFSENEVSKTNKIVMDKTQPITQERVVSRVRRYLSVSECDIFGFYSTHGDFVLLVKAITENPSKLQFVICNKEAQKIETLVHTASPMFTSDEILSSFRAVSSTTPQLSENLSEKKSSSFTCRFTGLSLLVPFMVAFVW